MMQNDATPNEAVYCQAQAFAVPANQSQARAPVE